jgi:hypothetical protein
MKKTALMLLFSLILLAGLGCNDYEDGPAISFRGKLDRLAVVERWVTYYSIDGVDQTAAVVSALDTTSYKTEGIRFALTFQGGGEIYCGSDFGPGQWDWEEGKKAIDIYFCGYSFPSATWDIRRLTNKDLWIQTIYGGKEHELHLEAP